MTQLTTPYVGVRDDVGTAPAPVPAPLKGVLVGATSDAVRAVTATWRRIALITYHLLSTVFVVVLLWLAGVQITPELGGSVVVAWPLLLAAAGVFRDRPLAEHAGARLGRVVRAGAALGLCSWLAGSLLGMSSVADPMVATTAALVVGAGLVTLTDPHQRRRAVRIAVAGAPNAVARAVDELGRAAGRYEVVLTCLTGTDTHSGLHALPANGIEVGVGHGEVVQAAASQGADALLVLPGADVTEEVLRRVGWHAERHGLALYVGTPLLDVAPTRTSVVRAGGLDAIHVRPAPARGPARLVKSVVERFLAAVALLALLPALVAIGIGVRLDSRGPALFRQQRVGKNGRLFTMYKFRTMTCEAEQQVDDLAHCNDADGVLFKLREDPRVTRLGCVLRRYSIDELPQLWNVVRGEMALVGPRPALPEEVAQYDVDPRRRLAVKPGLTGLWQVSGRSDLSWEESVRLDLKYVDNWSLPLDAAIVCRTFHAVLSHRGAY